MTASPSRPGRFEDAVVESAALVGNPLGDPTRRPLIVYLPPGYDDEPERRYPTVYVIQGFASKVEMWRNKRAFRRTFIERLDDVFAGGAPPCIVVFVDAWTAIGGSQFVDSPAIGRYHTYLCEDVVGFVDVRHRTIPAREHRGIMGHSSGGYGAMVSAMLRPDVWGGLATHAGDALFEQCYQKDFPDCARIISRQYDGSFERFWDDFRSRLTDKPGDFTVINCYAMAAAYSADPDGTIQFPFDLSTGQLVPEVWARWLAWDPVRMVPSHADALRTLRAVWIDGGKSDEWYLDLGAEAFRAALAGIGVVDNVHFDLFDGRHSGIDWRYSLSLAYLAERLS
jgi:S-formylglutathione hydrolase FrmB